MHRGGRGDARASCASPLGTPLTIILATSLSTEGTDMFTRTTKNFGIIITSLSADTTLS
jgi:hypothetical protein